MKMPPGYEMGGPMMPMPGMPRVYPPAFQMPGYPMMRPPMYPPGMMPPMPGHMDMMHKMNRMGGAMKPFPDTKTAPLVKKEKEKNVKKEEEPGKVLEFAPPVIAAETLKSLHLSVKYLQEPLFLLTCKNILGELEQRLKDRKLKGRKEISEFTSSLYDKIKETEKKDKKKGSSVNNNETPKVSELELISMLNEVYLTVNHS